MVDVAVSRMMGLVVVARLANRHGVKVELRPAAAERGTVAEVDSAHRGAGATGARRAPAARWRHLVRQRARRAGPRARASARPLALESGPTGGGRGSGQAPAYQTSGGFPAGRPFDPNPPAVSGGMLGGRSVPAWSDLTGAPGSNGSGSNGDNGFHGPRSNEMLPPIPSRPTAADDDSLPRRSNGAPYTEETGSFGPGASIPRQLPSNPEHQGRNPFVPPVSAPPVPAGVRLTVRPPGIGTARPRATRVGTAGVRPAGLRDVGLDAPHPSLVSPSGSYPVVPASAPPAAAAPPVWPPVAAERTPGPPRSSRRAWPPRST